MHVISKHKRKCKECTEIYEVSRDWQLFCGTTCRMRFNKRYREICFYCGIRGSHRHHVDPRSASGKHYFDGVEYVYCCSECNVTISDHLFEYLHEEVDYLIDKYVIKYNLRTPEVEWDEEEIEDLGKNLRQFISKKLAQRRKNEDRVYYLKSVKNYLLCDIEL